MYYCNIQTPKGPTILINPYIWSCDPGAPDPQFSERQKSYKMQLDPGQPKQRLGFRGLSKV